MMTDKKIKKEIKETQEKLLSGKLIFHFFIYYPCIDRKEKK